MTLHQKLRDEMFWSSKKGPVKVSLMTSHHINNVLITLETKTKNNLIWCGHHISAWRLVLKAEMTYRSKMGYSFIKACKAVFPNSKML